MNEEFADRLADCFEREGRKGREKCVEMAESKGWEHIGRGKSREVFTDGDVVLKSKRHAGKIGIRENKNEAEWWNTVEGTDLESHFAAVLDHDDDHDWVVMEYYPEDLKTWDKMENIEDTLDESDVVCSDLNTTNFKQKGDEVAVIDYGQECWFES